MRAPLGLGVGESYVAGEKNGRQQGATGIEFGSDAAGMT